VKQYDDIKGNLKWALLGPIWVVIAWVGNRLLHMIPQIPTWTIWLIVLVASSIVFILGARIGGGKSRPSNTAQTATTTLVTSPNFDATTFFRTAYVSPLQPEARSRQNKKPRISVRGFLPLRHLSACCVFRMLGADVIIKLLIGGTNIPPLHGSRPGTVRAADYVIAAQIELRCFLPWWC
jgi:hypothetical protein